MLSEFVDGGHVYYRGEQLMVRTSKELEIGTDILATALESLKEQDKLVIEESDEGERPPGPADGSQLAAFRLPGTHIEGRVHAATVAPLGDINNSLTGYALLHNQLANQFEKARQACKPDSVPLVRAVYGPACRTFLLPAPEVVAIHLGPMSPSDSCGQPGDADRASDPTRRKPSSRCPSIWPCSRWGLAASSVAIGGRELLPPVFTLACAPEATPVSYSSSIAACLWSHRRYGFCATFRRPGRGDPPKRLGVTQHPARRSPDFPLPGLWPRSGHPACLA